MGNKCLLVKIHVFCFHTAFHRKADESTPSFVVVLVLSVACGFLCLIPIGLYSKQIYVKLCSKCLHLMFYLFHPF